MRTAEMPWDGSLCLCAGVLLKDGSVPSRLGFQAPGRQVHCMAWAGLGSSVVADEWEAREKEVMVGYKSGLVELYNTQSRELIARFDALSLPRSSTLRAGFEAQAARAIDPATRAPKSINATSQLVGMAVLQAASAASSSRTHERRLLTCSSGGVVHIRPFSTLTLDGEEEEEEEEKAAPAPAAKSNKKGKRGASPALSAQPAPGSAAAASASAPVAAAPAAVHVSSSGASSFLVGSHICSLKVEPLAQSLFACGGKEHMLKLWDLSASQGPVNVWKEKNVAHDMLNLRQQVWITDLAFVPNSGGAELVTGTAWHQVRSYDTRASKKALYSVEVGDHAITCIDVSADGRFIIAGDGSGRLQQLDRRMGGRMVHVYRGMGGSVRGIQAHESSPMLAAVGLDRFLRVYDVHTRAQLHKIYLKQKLNAVLFSAQTPAQAKESDEAQADAEAEAARLAAANDEDDELWKELHKRSAQRVKQEEGVEAATSASASAGNGSGLYVKKRKAPTGDATPSQEDEHAHTSKKGKGASQQPLPKVKIEPVDSEDDGTTEDAAAPKDDDDDGEEQEDDEDMQQNEEDDDEGEEEDGEDEEEEEGEEEEELEPEPAPAPTPSKKRGMKQAAAAAAPPSTRSTRSRR
jgi:ribosome biogenesis protein NSA1